MLCCLHDKFIFEWKFKFKRNYGYKCILHIHFFLNLGRTENFWQIQIICSVLMKILGFVSIKRNTEMYDSRPKLKRQFRYFDIFKGPFINHVDSEGGEGMLEAGLRGQNFFTNTGCPKVGWVFWKCSCSETVKHIDRKGCFLKSPDYIFWYSCITFSKKKKEMVKIQFFFANFLKFFFRFKSTQKAI